MVVDPIGAGRRILIVEDEYLVASHLEMVLEDLGFAVVRSVATIPEAIAAIADEAPEAVILDANLDGISSAPVAEELAARGVPFVVVTGYGDLELPSAALQSARRVHKPFTMGSLAVVLGEVLGGGVG